MNDVSQSHTRNSGSQSRRSFLKRAAVVAAAGSTPLLRPRTFAQAPSVNVTGANNRIVLAILGAGSQGMHHIRLVRRLQEAHNVRVGAVCDVYQKRLEQGRQAAELPEADAVREHERLMERKDIDAVVIATVDNWHAQMSLDALDTGKHVYCEKPMTRHLEEGFAVYDRVRATGKVFQCGSQFTADAVYHTAARWIQEGRLGPLVWAQGTYCRNHPNNSEWTYPVDPDANPDNLDWHRWLYQAPRVPWNPDHYFSWHKYYAYNSGILGNLLSHRFLPLMLAAGNPEWPRRVVCTGTRKVSTDREITDTTHVLAEFPGGLTCFIAGSTVNETGLPDAIRGRQGTLTLSGNRLEFRPERIFSDHFDPEVFTDQASMVGKVENLHTNFWQCIREGGKPFCDVDLSVKANTVLCLAEMSRAHGPRAVVRSRHAKSHHRRRPGDHTAALRNGAGLRGEPFQRAVMGQMARGPRRHGSLLRQGCLRRDPACRRRAAD
jgi:predicted dehydrogenase